jgi:hypothetical protein
MGRWTKVLQTARIVASDEQRLAKYCPDLDRWPQSWSIEPRDIAPGKQVVECFKPFLLHLLRRRPLIRFSNLFIQIPD